MPLFFLVVSGFALDILATRWLYINHMKNPPFVALALCLFACTDPAPAESVTETMTDISVDVASVTPDSLLRHVVLFSFKEDSYPAGVKTVEDAFAALPGQISEIYDYEWGTNNSPEGLDKGYTHLFFVTFKSEADRAVYLPHPAHLAFVEVLKPHLREVLVVDYWTQ